MWKQFLIITSMAYFMLTPTKALALSLELEDGAFGDIIRIKEISPDQNIQSTRVSPTELYVGITNFDLNNFQTPSINTNLINSVTPNSSGFVIEMDNTNFGYIQSQNNDDIIINLYPDNLGSRWRATTQTQALFNQLQSNQSPVQNQTNGQNLNQSQETGQTQNQNQENNQNTVQNQNITTNEEAPQLIQPPQSISNQTNPTTSNQVIENLSQSQTLIPTPQTSSTTSTLNNTINQVPPNNNSITRNITNNITNITQEGSNNQNQPLNNNLPPQTTSQTISQNTTQATSPEPLQNIQNTQESINQAQPTENSQVSQEQITETTVNNITNTSESLNPEQNTETIAQNPENTVPTEENKTSFTFSLSDENIDDAKPATEDQIKAFLQGQEKVEEIKNTETESEEVQEEVQEEEKTEEANEDEIPKVGEIIYMDEEGNVVPAPIDIGKTMEELEFAFENMFTEVMLEKADLLKDKSIPIEMLERVLYARLMALYDMHRDNLAENSFDVIGAAQELINANANFQEMPQVLEILIDTYLALGREEEAEAYVNRLLEGYPNNDETPTALYLLANFLMEKGEYARASSLLEQVINNYPDGTISQNAALLQTQSLYKQGDVERTKAFIDFMDRRWPRLYLSNPEYLTIRGEVDEISKDYAGAIETYWLMYNLNPMGEMADFALDNLSRLYFLSNDPVAASKVLDTLIQDFPDSVYRPDALMMKAEYGNYPDPSTLQEIYSVFEKPNPILPELYYKQLADEYPDSDQGRIAKLKLAAHALYTKDYKLAADLAKDFYAEYITTKDADIAYDILHQAVTPLMDLALEENNYEQTLSLFENYPQVQKSYEPYSAKLRMAMARALINRKQPIEAEEVLDTFLVNKPTNQQELDDSIYAYNYMLLNALAKQDWTRVLEVTSKLDGWDLPKDVGLQRLYSTALAAENLNLPARSLPIWQALAPNEEVPLYQRAYAQYFLARDAERRQNLRESYQANLDTLAMFEDLKNLQSPYADDERIRESVAALMDITEIAGRYAESMQWLNRYLEFVPQNSPDYAGVQLREARLSKKMGDNMRWQAILEQVRAREPDSVFGKMADSELKAFDIARDINRFTGQN